MLKICSSNKDEIEISAKAQDLNSVAQEIIRFLESDEECVAFECDRSFDPTPYDSVLNGLRVIKGDHPARVSLTDGKAMQVEGTPESFSAFASFFEFDADATVGDHAHFEYQDYEDNRFTSPGSIPLVIRMSQ